VYKRQVVYGVDVSGLPEACLKLLRERGLTFATAESCTGGLVAERITALPGASKVYRGGVVSYWTDMKHQILGVSQETLRTYGPVSEQCAREMAEGARRITGADLAVSVTGVAGPEKGSSTGMRIRTDYLSFKFFMQDGWGGEFAGDNALKLTGDAAKYIKDAGNFELADGVTLEEGAVYEITVDLTAGASAGTIDMVRK